MVIFEQIKYKNFMSVGNSYLTIQLNKSKTTLISATNGVGKSVLLDAICFVLFGRAYRNINKPQLVNSINLKQAVVEIEFSVGKKKYRVVRGMKPGIFEIYENNILVNQDPNVKDYQKVLEQQILKMNFRAFTQVVVMGSAAYVPFMKLKTGDRREFIEDLLDIRVFSVMNKLLSQEIKTTKESLKTTEAEIISAKEVVAIIETHIASRSAEKNTKIALVKSEIEEIMASTDISIERQKTIDDEYKELQVVEKKYNKFREALQTLVEAKDRCAAKITSLNSEIANNASLETCHTCKQTLNDDIRARFSTEATQNLPKYESSHAEILTRIDKATAAIAKLEYVVERMTYISSEKSSVNRIIYGNQLLLDKLNRELSELIAIPSVDAEKDRLKDTAKKVVALDKKRQELRESTKIQEAGTMLLQDTGIKSKIIKQYIPLINKLVNKYLAKLDFFCQFTLDEGFNEIVKSRHRDAFSYDSFSQGEKQRIDLSLIFAWRDISAMKNSVHTNLIIMDEMLDSAVDLNGMELCFDLIKEMKKSNVFVVSHREAIADKFESTIKLIKKNNFTEIGV